LQLSQNSPKLRQWKTIRRRQKGEHTVSAFLTSLTFSRLAGVLAALWLCGAGTAWAGDGGDLASLNQLLNTPTTGLCAILKIKTCPQLPTITQGILEVAGLGNSPPEMVAAQNSIAPGSNVIAGNPAAVPPDDLLPLNSSSSPTLQELLKTLTPLAFISQKSGTAAATQLYDPNADTDLFRVAQNFTKGQIVAKFSFPPTVLNSDGTENPAVMGFEVGSGPDGVVLSVGGPVVSAPHFRAFCLRQRIIAPGSNDHPRDPTCSRSTPAPRPLQELLKTLTPLAFISRLAGVSRRAPRLPRAPLRFPVLFCAATISGGEFPRPATSI
jgi:hypothetical protein